MNTETKLPDDVIAEIQANRKIAAIKLLRSHQGIGLKEVKEVVDTYADKHPSSIRVGEEKPQGDFGRIPVLILGVEGSITVVPIVHLPRRHNWQPVLGTR
ncbi:MAG: hypothetical protein ACJAYC_002155 [Halieaceae bacterium]|jgi:hypothetical protein